MIRYILALLSFFAVFLLSAGEVFLFQTTDLHGIMHNSGENSGTPSVLAAISEDADRIGRDKTILIDCGDLLQGSLESAEDKGETMIRLLNAAKYDIWVPGNHDFEFGPKIFSKRIAEFKGTTLAANLKFPNIKSYKVIEKNGYKIAIVGITNPHLGLWLFNHEEEGFHVLPAEISYRQLVPALRKIRADVIILAIHSGIYPSKRLDDPGLFSFARRHPEVQVILGGHTHEKIVCKELGKSKVCYFQAGAHGGGYLRIKLIFDDSKKRLKEVSGEYVPVAPCSNLPEKFRIQKKYHPVICRNFPVRLSEKKIAELFALAIHKEIPGIRGVFHGALTAFRPKKPILNRIHLFQLCPFENKVVIGYITKAEFDAIIKEHKDSEKAGMRQYSWCHPETLEIWKNNPEKRLPFAFNSYVASSAGGRFPVLKNILTHQDVKAFITEKRIFDLLENYVKEVYK